MIKNAVKIFLLYMFYLFSTSQLLAVENSSVMNGAVAEKRGDYEQAIKEYKDALANNPDFVELYISIGNIYRFKLQDTPNAIQIYLRGLKVVPNSFDLNLNLMYCYFEQGDFDKGVEYYDTLSKLRNENQKYSFPRDILEIKFKDITQEAKISFCKKYLAINPTDIILREILANCYMNEKDYQNAKIHYEAIIQYSGETGFLYFSLGVCDYYLKDYKNSLKSFLKAKVLGSYVPESYFNTLNKNLKEAPGSDLEEAPGSDLESGQK